jgi:threonine dehydrogenase-like Zn-dependent dehydrogenase
MRAVKLGPEGLDYDAQAAQPEAGPGEVLVRVTLAGICSTDLELIQGYFGYQGILGHEFVGVVEQTRDPRWQGKRVVSSINFADVATPEFAAYGREHHPHRRVLGILGCDGCMADHVVVPTANLLEVPGHVPDEAAVFCEPLAAALRIPDQIPVRPSARAAVVGPGRLGMLIGKVLSLNGCQVTMLARTAESLALANRWGLYTNLVEEAVTSSYDLVVEATGNATGWEQAIRLTKPQGMLVMKSTYAAAPQIDMTKLVVDEIRVIGSRCGPFAPALRLLASGTVEVQALIEGEYPPEQAEQAFAHAARKGVRKILLRFQ